MSEGYVCNLIVPGFAKCGTSSFHEYLNQHWQICMSNPKEPHHFTIGHTQGEGAAEHNRIFNEFREDIKLYGESSTSYAVWEPALRLIAKSLKSPRVIVLIRDPIARLISHYRWMCSIGHERESLEATIKREMDEGCEITKSRGGCFPWYLRHSNYSYFCPLMIEILGADNILFVKTEELSENPTTVWHNVLAFLDVDDFEVNTDRRTRQTRQHAAVPPILSRFYLRAPKPIRDSLLRSGAVDIGRRFFARGPSLHNPNEVEIAFVRDLLARDIEFYERQLPCCTGGNIT